MRRVADELDEVLYSTIACIPVPCIISRRSTTEIVAVNDAAVEFFGYERRTLLSLDVASITDPTFRAELGDNYANTFATGLTTVKNYLRADGTSVECQLVARPVVSHPELAIAVIIDLELSDSLRNGSAVTG